MLLLASSSPRRANILRSCGVEFEILKTDAPEVTLPDDPVETVRRNACAKHAAAEAAWRAAHPGAEPPPILAADTIVWCAGRILGKPRDAADAAATLRFLSGRTHTVFTGVACGLKTEVVTSRVTFRDLSDAAIADYISRAKPFDRAGSYDIDVHGDLLVARLDGDYENVMGLPRAPLVSWGLLGNSSSSRLPEYEVAGIETIARGICIQDGCVLLCRAKGGNSTYLPGGHIEFGETGAAALAREMREEMGVEATVCERCGVVENSFLQHGKPHAEINLVYRMTLPPSTPASAREDWIEFTWCPLSSLPSANLLPAEMSSCVLAQSL